MLFAGNERLTGMTILAQPFSPAPRLDRTSPTPLPNALTAGEFRVLSLVAIGHSNSGIADHLCLSPKTVEGRLSSIFDKLGLQESRSANRRVLAVLQFLSWNAEGAR